MNKKNIIGIIVSIVVVLAMAGVGSWMLLHRSAEETGGNKLGVEWYDVNGKEFVITTADELYELSELSNYYDFKNQTIKLGADIVVNEGNAKDWEKKAPSRKWAPINGFGGTFDGQGHTISGLYAKGYDAAIALFSNTMSGATVQNFKVMNSYFESAGFGGVASISSNGGGKFKQIYSDAILNVVGTYSGFAGGICSKLNLQSSLEECWFDGVINTTGRDAGGILDDVLGSRVTISHCLFSGEINSAWDFSGGRTGGVVGRIAEEGAGLVLTDCLSTGVINAATIYYTGSVLGTTTANTSLTTTNSYGSMGSYDVAIGRSGFSGTINSYPIELHARELVGTKAYQWTNLDFNTYWAIVEDDTPILKCFAENAPSVAGLEKEFDTSWYTEGASEYVIMDRADLYGLYMLSASNTFTGKTIKVGADIVINDGKAKDWAKSEPENIWYPILKFAGTFDGQGHTISGLYLNTAAEKAGFFKETMPTAVVKNMSLKNSYLESTTTANAFLGSIAGRGGGNFDSIYSDAIMVSQGSIVGGIFAQVNAEAKNSFTNCWFDGSITMKGETARYVGGVVGGIVKGNTTIAHCLNTGAISQLDFKDAGMFVGGIVGYIINDKTVGNISDCLNTGKISVNYHVCVGSVVGRLNQAAVTISDTYATNESYIYEDGNFRGIGTSSKGYTGGVINFPESYLVGMGGYQWSTLNFKDYWTVVTGPDSTPILKSFANKVPSVSGVTRKIDTSWYSTDKKSFALKDLEDLYGFYAVSGFDSFFEDTVKLEADIVVNEGTAAEWAKAAPANPWFTIHNFKGTFDGQGHTISGVYLKTDKTYAGLFSKTTKESTLKNFKLTNSYFENTIADEMAAFGSVAGQMGGVIDTVYSDAIVVGKGTQIGGLVGRANPSKNLEYKITNCWFDGQVSVTNSVAQLAYVGGIVGTSVQGTLVMDNCLNTGEISYTYTQMPEGKVRTGVAVGGIVGGVMNGVRKDTKKGTPSELQISDSLNTGYAHAQTSMGTEHPYNDGVRSIVGFTTDGTVTISDDVYASKESAIGIINYNNDRATVKNKATLLSESIVLGTKGYSYTLLDFNKYWSARSEQTPALKSFVGKGLDCSKAWKIDTEFDGKGTKLRPYIISSVGELYGFAHLVNNGNDFAEQYIKVANDININKDWNMGNEAPEYIWTPIGTTQNPFAGTFDGNSKKISGIYVTCDDANMYVGLFGVTADAAIKEFILSNSLFTGTAAAMGAIVGNGDGTLLDIHCDNSVLIETSSALVGGMVGRVQDPLQTSDENRIVNTLLTVNNCWFEGSVKQNNGKDSTTISGGIVGFLIHGTANIDNCLFTGKMSCEKHVGTSKDLYVGGVLGKANGKSSTQYSIKNSLSAGSEIKATVSGCDKYVGAITGQAQGNEVFENVYATSECATQSIGTGTNQSAPITLLNEENFMGIKGYQMTMLNFENYWSARTDKVPALKAFIGNGITIPKDTWRFDDSWYSEEKAEFELETEGQLFGFASLVNSGKSFKDKTVTLKKDMVIEDYAWTPIGTSAANSFQGTFDGKGKTIGGIHVTLNDSKNYIGLFGWVADATIKNFTLSDSTFKGTATAMGAIVGNGDGTLSNIYCDDSVILETTSTTIVGGMFGRVQDPMQKNDEDRIKNTLLTVSNCWFEGSIEQTIGANNTTIAGGIVGFLIHGTANIDNCLFTGNIDSNKTTGTNKHLYVGGVFGKANGTESTNYSIKSSLSAGSEISATVNSCSKFVGAIAGQVQGNEVFENVYATSECSTQAIGTGTNPSEKITMISEESYTGIKGYQMTMLNFEEYWSARTDKVPALKTFVGNGMTIPAGTWRFDDRWYNEETTKFEIQTEGQLYGFASLVNNGTTFKDKTVTLKKDMVIVDSAWVPIGESATNSFKGTFDGNGKTISGIHVTLNDSKNYIGLFGWVADATIKNFTLSDSTFKGTATAMGAIVGNGDGTLSNIYCDDSVILETTSTTIVGGMFGRVQDPMQKNDEDRIKNTLLTVSNCWFEGSIEQTIGANNTTIAGGIVGFLIHGTANIDNCLFTGNIDSNKTTGTNKHLYVGGVFGKANGTESTNYSIKSSLSAGSEIKATVNGCSKYVGAIAGQAQGNETFTNVYATSKCANLALGEVKGSAAQLTSPVDESTFYGNLGDDNTELDFTIYWATRSGKVPALKYFVDRSAISNDVMWLFVSLGSEADPYMLSNESEFTKFATLVNTNGYSFKDKTLKLNDNITVTATAWQPIGVEATPFQGTFDGNGKTISGIQVTKDYKYKGLFGWVADATIKNFTLSNSKFSGKGTAIAAIVGNGDGTLSNIYCDSSVLVETTAITIVGGIVGRVQDPLQKNDKDRIANTLLTVSNCWFEGAINHTINSNSTTISGGIVGYVIHGTVNIDNCLFTGTMDSKKTTGTSKHLYVGGIVGKANGTSTTSYSIKNSLSAGSEIKAMVNGCSKFVGAITGQAQGNETFANVYATSECAALAAGELQGDAAQPTIPVASSTLYGESGKTNTKLDFNNYWITRNGKVPALKFFVKE